MTNTDHDLLARMDENLIHLVESVREHLIDDKESFKGINQKINWGGSIIFMGLGALALLKFFPILKLFVH